MRNRQFVDAKQPMDEGVAVDVPGDNRIRYPDRAFDGVEVPPGPALCTRCHAFLETDHWRYDERHYRELQERGGAQTTLCPGCTRVERRLYEGELVLRHSGWQRIEKGEVLNLIHNTEARVRAANPTARIALLEDRGDELYILTTTRFLAERIGKALYRAYKGELEIMPLPRERFTRVRWERAA